MPTPTDADAGCRVAVDYRKWDGTAHWQNVGRLLGVDGHGLWVGAPRGTHFERPGAAFDIDQDSVTLFPAAGFTPAFNALSDPDRVRVYVDTTTSPQWQRDGEGWRVSMVDLDLDVVQLAGGLIYVDDEDEFAEHSAAFGYPDDVVTQARVDTRAVFAALRDRRAPFDATADRWLDRLAHGRS